MTALICLAVAMLAAGIVIAMLPSASKGNHKITVRNDGSVVTVRSASSSDITVTFDPSDLHPEEPPVLLSVGSEPLAEEEPSILEEFVDPRTSIERKREIARTFNGLKCEFKLKEYSPKESSASGVSPEEASMMSDSDDGCDEGILFPDSDEFES
jgi:hypothetical protein